MSRFLSLATAAVALFLLSTHACAAGTFSVVSLTGDADSGITAGSAFTHAFNVNAASNGTVNGAVFTGTGQLAAGVNPTTNNYSTTGFTSSFVNNATSPVTGVVGGFMTTFRYNGNPASLTLKNLRIGQQYETTFYDSAYGGAGIRVQSITVSDGGSIVHDENAQPGGRLIYTFTAASNTLTFTFTPQTAGTFHLYAFSNRAVGPQALLTDNFYAPSNPTTTNLNFNLAARQGGTLVQSAGTIAWIGTGNAQVGNITGSIDGGNYLLTASSGKAALDHNFNGAESSSGLSISFDLAPDVTAVGGTNWNGISLGQSAADKSGAVSGAQTHFGVLFRGSAGTLQAYDGSTVLTPTEPSWGSTGVTSQLHHFELIITDSIDGNPFDGAGETRIQVYADGVLRYTFTKSGGGYAENYLNFQSSQVGGLDNLVIARLSSAPAAPVISAQPQPQMLWFGDSAVLSVIASGVPAPTYQWLNGGDPIGSATGSTLLLTNAALADAGSYTVTVTNASGSVTSTPAAVNVIYPNRWQRVAEPLAVSSKKTGFVFSEINPHPVTRLDGRNLEFIELYNTNPWPEDLTGWRISGDVNYVFPAGTIIPAQGFLVVAASPSDMQAVYGIPGVLGPWQGALSNSGGTLRLRRKNDAIVLEGVWSDGPAWPVAADGAGHSLVLARPSYGEGDVRAWSASAAIGGSPGTAEAPPASPQDHVLINEIFAHSTTAADFIELYNSSPLSVDVSGCFLSNNSTALTKFAIPAGTLLPPRGRVSFTQAQFGFSLKAEGETVYFTNAALTRVLDAVRYREQLPDTASGLSPDGEGAFRRLVSATPGAANAAAARGPVVINELYFHPITNDDQEEWLELRNLSGAAVSLADWRLSEGVTFTFPAGASIPASGYVVVAKNPARVQANHPGLSAGAIFGPFTGTLGDSGEEVVLRQPVTPAGGVVFFAPVDEVNYSDASRWAKWADGGGSSLELADARNTATPLWLDSDETAKAPWTLVETTGVLDNVNSNASAIANKLDAQLLNEGEALLDEVEATPAGGSNLVTNGGFESGIGSWLVQGSHNTSVLENSGYAGAKSLRLVATGRGDPLPNHVRTPLSATIAANTTATIRARARWLHGSPDFLLRLRGGGLEAYGALIVPTNLGTPGAANSRAVTNAAPAITDVLHRPALPAADVPFRVFARISDPDGVATVQLKYRVDPSATLSTVTMVDDGSNGDLLAGDGIFTGAIPAQAAGNLLGFTITATDSATVSTVFPPTGECLARVGDNLPTGAFGAYSMWITNSTLTAWTNRLLKTNEPFPITFLHNNSRIFYGTGAHFAQFAEPANSNPTNTIIGYGIDLPPGETLLGENQVTLDIPIRDVTNQREQLMHWMLEQMNLPTLYRRDVHLMVNGVRRTSAIVPIFHDCHQPGRSHLDSNFPNDARGHLLKTSRWDETSDANGVLAGDFNSLLPFTTTDGVYKTARYRWCWMPRSAQGSENDFADFFNLVTAANIAGSGAPYVDGVKALVDVDQWMANFAFADLCAFWDTFGNPNHKNAYLYKPTLDRWKVITNDMDVGLGADNSNHHPSTEPLFAAGVDTPVQKMYDTPALVRPYWRALSDSLGTFFSGSAVTTRITQRYNGYIANGVAVASPLVGSGFYNLSIPAWIDLRVAYVQSQLNTVSAPFAVNGPTTFTTNTRPITITGTAPVSVKTITFNGLEVPLTWTSTTAWSASVNVASGTNPLVVTALDSAGTQTGSVTLTVTFTGTNAWAALRINEWMADNNGAVLDPADGHPDDWIELYNPTGAIVSLASWTLGDTMPMPTTFVIPSGYSIAAGGRLLVWADNETVQNTGSGQLHVPFKLSSSGETLTLRSPDGTLVDTVTFGTQVQNISQGRTPDGGTTIDFLSTPSAATANAAPVAPPAATVGNGTPGNVSIIVNTTPGFRYQLQVKASLTDATWINSGAAFLADSTTHEFTDVATGQTQRFYRVVRTP